ncbi:IclR family transcriptional regulator C-terminal domain-containing protein [Coraliomargarita algicola]|uniref:IclR family transcriptional regulator C-terminal domain-containing protein n=1 Tax=Coraliomargarita algicola TaxID=3092156 RepID=A0ABZ0RIV0_9BACT|nr:IclR family transcriptional regulator C-terminal domain-containing protein [Coraliomargarita sp. J2-16]WPJ96131.1 IclR family transcriptional regulator C-terminal domain-containing protein [Coraliomargarita sp. J2-16]
MQQRQPIQSIQRAVQILYLIAGVEEGLSIPQITARTGLKSNTAYNIIRTLEAEKLVIRKQAPLRFLLGSAIHELATLNNEQQLLSITSEELLNAQKHNLDSSFMLVERDGNGTFKRMFTDGHRPGVVIKCRDFPVPPYVKATSLLLLAYASEERRQNYYKNKPFEELGRSAWKSQSKLEAYLKKIKREGYSSPNIQSEDVNLYTVAAPIVSENNEVNATVGAYISMDSKTSDKALLHELTIQTAKKISMRLKVLSTTNAPSSRTV